MAHITYTEVEGYGLMASDGWVEGLDPARSKAEAYLLRRCPNCHRPYFDLMHMFDPMYDRGFCEPQEVRDLHNLGPCEQTPLW